MSLKNLRIALLAMLTLAFVGMAAAQSEPTIKQIYDTAQSGQLDQARQMTQEVLRNHPNSAKAHFVMAELDAAKGNASEANAQLAQAESLAPGLPFASAQAVQALRARLSSQSAARSPSAARTPAAAPARDAPSAPGFPWGLVILAAGVVAVIATVLRSRAAAREREAAAYGGNAHGAPAGTPGWGRQPDYAPQAGYGAPPAQPGMGSQVMGGLATGLAVGAGALAAQEIGRRMLGEHGDHGQQGLANGGASHPQTDSPLARDAGLDAVDGRSANPGLPEDFGIADGGSWDDGGSVDMGGVDDGGGGWDS